MDNLMTTLFGDVSQLTSDALMVIGCVKLVVVCNVFGAVLQMFTQFGKGVK